jgi:hypothetical protein
VERKACVSSRVGSWRLARSARRRSADSMELFMAAARRGSCAESREVGMRERVERRGSGGGGGGGGGIGGGGGEVRGGGRGGGGGV